MARYMKTDMPFYGVQKAARTKILRDVVSRFPPMDRHEYVANVRLLWDLDHREEKYLAIGYARSFDQFVDVHSLRLYRELVVEGAWWDLVDETAIKLIGVALGKSRVETEPTVRSWISHDDLWLVRTSIICQIGHKEDTDASLLGDACVANFDQRDFFIRKAIGWALREYAKTDPAWVICFLAAHESAMAPLSVREAEKHLAR